MADALHFLSWRQPSLVTQALAAPVAGRRAGRLDLLFTDSTQPGAPAPGGVGFALRSGGDVAGLSPRAIRHRAPAPGIADAEDTKFVHVDFHAPDLPWRYSLDARTGDAVRPWLALLVGTPEEIRVSGRAVTVVPGVLQDYFPLTQSHLWAHLQVPPGEGSDTAAHGRAGPARFSRLLSLRRLTAQTAYVVVLVPTIAPGGADRWDSAGRVTGGPLPVLDTWRFSTAEAGDFESLCRALRLRSPRGLGRAALTYRRPDPATGELQPLASFEVRGALSSLTPVPEAPLEEVAPVTAHLRSLHDLDTPPDGPEPLGLPGYGPPWVDRPEAITGGWVRQLHEDPRDRIHAGTGVTIGVEAQDELMRAAVEQAGALQEASALIARTATGLSLSAELWERHLPRDGVARLAVLAPQAARLRDGSGTVLADAVSDEGTHLVPELFGGAAQRLLARTDPAAAWQAVNHGDPSPQDAPDSESRTFEALVPSEDQWLAMGIGQDLRERLEEFLRVLLEEMLALGREHRRGRGDHRADPWEVLDLAMQLADHAATLVSDLLGDYLSREPGDECSWAGIMERAAHAADSLAWLDAEQWGAVDGAGLERTAVQFFARGVTGGGEEHLAYGTLQDQLLACLAREHLRGVRLPTPDTRRPVHLEGLGDALTTALDPRGPRPPARASLEGRVTGLPLDDLGPPRFPLGLDYPTWSLLREHEPDWFLPGAQTLAPDSIVALRTNPAFISAYLLGLNTQFLAEARWRGLPVDPVCTPLRMFFAPVDAVDRTRTPDVLPVRDWGLPQPLGDPAHQFAPGGHELTPPERLVILFRTTLFRRYPRTMVYLQAAHASTDDKLALAPDFEPPEIDDEELLALWHADRPSIPPAFTGSIGPDLVFFVFDVAPSALDSYLVVLDEPPSETRFGENTRGGVPRDTAHFQTLPSSAEVAEAALDRHTRVAIDGAALEQQGGGQ